MSLTKVLFHRLSDPIQALILTGVLSSSYSYLGNVSSAWFGIMPLVQSGTTTPTAQQKAALWRFFYDKAKVHFIIANITSTTSYAVAAYLLRGPVAVIVRKPLLAAAGISALFLPYTAFALLSTNEALVAIQEDSEAEPDGKEVAASHDAVDSYLEKWRKGNAIRMSITFTAWMAGLASLIAYRDSTV